jgi:DHA3 family macrolide efflux protein-like MFS transporter
MAVGLITVTITTLIQLSTPDQMRGRIFGVLAMISSSLAPIAMVLSGVVADLVDQNIPVIYISCGAILLILTTISVLNKDFRAFVSQDLTENLDQSKLINPNQALPS